MYCVKCGNDINDNARFCNNCGAFVPDRAIEMIHCPNCGGEVEINEDFASATCKFCQMKMTLTDELQDYANELRQQDRARMIAIVWPTEELTQQLPVPESNIGNISDVTDYRAEIYIGETTEEAYNSYLNKCIAAGFNVDANRIDSYYSAENSDGYSLSLEYEVIGIMKILIYEPFDN